MRLKFIPHHKVVAHVQRHKHKYTPGAIMAITIAVATPILFNIFPHIPQPAKAATFVMQTGQYLGDGTDNRAITNVGFQPDLVMIKDHSINGVDGMIFKTSVMSGENTADIAEAEATSTANQIQSLDASGFTVGSDADTNAAGVQFSWVAFDGSDCTSSGTFCVGKYTGTGGGLSITTGFKPDVVIVKAAGAQVAVWRSSSMAANSHAFFGATVSASDGTRFTTLDNTGFTLGTNAQVNSANADYYYIAFKNVTTAMYAGTYNGTGVDNRNITDATNINFKPDFMFTKKFTGGTARAASFSTNESYGDYSYSFADAAAVVNMIQALITNGFQVGSGVQANENTYAYHYVVFGGAGSPNSVSGSYTMATGTYTGNGTSQSVTGLGFRPSLVMVKSRNASTVQYAIYRPGFFDSTSNSLLFGNTISVASAITSIDSDGFTVGSAAAANANGDVFDWTAFGNAWRPDVSGGASDFAVGYYVGNGIDNRDITRLPFQPDFLIIQNVAGAARQANSTFTADNTATFAASAFGSNMIQAFNSDGFEIGADTNVNTANTIHVWFAFKAGTNFKVNSYSGGGSGQTLSGLGFQPDLVWTTATAKIAALRSGGVPDDYSSYFNNTAGTSGLITTTTNDGFTVGTNTNIDAAGTTYHYAAWNAKQYRQMDYRFFANTDTTDVGAALADQNTVATLSAAGSAFRLRMLVHASSSPLYKSKQNFKLQFVGKGSGTCAAPSGGTPASYTDVTAATVIAYKNNTPADDAALTANANDPVHGTINKQSYVESNNFSNDIDTLASNTRGMWDFALYDNGAAANTAYCFRIIKSDGTVMDGYDQYPQITTANAVGDPTWVTGAADYDVYQSSVTTWDNGTLVCSGTLTDTNADTINCAGTAILPSTQYRVQVTLKNVGASALTLQGASEYVEHKNVKAGWAGTNPTLGNCAFNDVSTDNGATTCTAAWSSNDVRITNTGGGNVSLAATSGTEGFAYLITTDSDAGSNPTNYWNAAVDSQTQTSSKIAMNKISEFEATVMASSGDYATLSAWEAAVSNGNIDLTAATVKVFSHGGKTGTINDGASVTGATSGATATVVHATNSQILLKGISGVFQSGEQVRVDVSNHVTISNYGDGVIATAKIDGAWGADDTTAVTIAGWTTDVDNYIRIYTSGSSRHAGTYSTTAYRLVPTGVNSSLDIQEEYVRIDGLQFSYAIRSSAGQDDIINYAPAGTGELQFSNNIVRATGSSTGTIVNALYLNGASGTAKVWNNLFYDFYVDDGVAKQCINRAAGTAYIYNNTMYNCKTFINGASTVTAINNIGVGGSGTNYGYNGTFNAASNYNSSSIGSNTTGGANDTHGVTPTFTDTSAKNFHVASGDTVAKDTGTPLNNDTYIQFTSDYEGTSRPYGAQWDRGADEGGASFTYASSGSFISSSIDTNSYAAIAAKNALRLRWSQIIPSGCSLDVYIRGTSNGGATPDYTGVSWSGPYSGTGSTVVVDLTGITDLQNKRYYQYKVEMASCSSNAQSPTLFDIDIDID